MAMASLSASLLARKGTARPVGTANTQEISHKANRIQFIPHDVPRLNDDTTHSQESSKKGSHTTKQNNSVFKHNGVAGKTRQISHDYKRKSVRLAAPTDQDLRLLAASMGVSQQSIMEAAIKGYLARAFKERGCICRPAKTQQTA